MTSASQHLLEAALSSVEYHRRRRDTEYPGYIWVEWCDLVAFIRENTPQVGYTGTQRGLTVPQCNTLQDEMGSREPMTLHHGDCVGGDKTADILAENECVIHPCTIRSKRAHCASSFILPVKPPLIRNHDIVDATIELLACPGEYEEVLRSGTWATIRYARKLRRPITIIYPDGTTCRENHE